MYALYFELIIKFFLATREHISNLEYFFFTLKKLLQPMSLSQLSSNESKTKHIAIRKLVWVSCFKESDR
jgi:hypothetical protein